MPMQPRSCDSSHCLWGRASCVSERMPGAPSAAATVCRGRARQTRRHSSAWDFSAAAAPGPLRGQTAAAARRSHTLRRIREEDATYGRLQPGRHRRGLRQLRVDRRSHETIRTSGTSIRERWALQRHAAYAQGTGHTQPAIARARANARAVSTARAGGQRQQSARHVRARAHWSRCGGQAKSRASA